jgi:dCMP deaminase
MARLSLDEYLMGVASVVKARSDWPGTKVGCVAATEGMILSTGYNGTPKGWHPQCEVSLLGIDDALAKTIRGMKPYFCHAEENVIVQAARVGVMLETSTFYSTLSCCLTCARMMVNLGISRFVYLTKWDGEESSKALALLTDSSIVVKQLIP